MAKINEKPIDKHYVIGFVVKISQISKENFVWENENKCIYELPLEHFEDKFILDPKFFS